MKRYGDSPAARRNISKVESRDGPMKALRRFTVRAHLPDRMAALDRLSINLRWSWDKPTQDLFATIDPKLWKQVGYDPVALLGQVNPGRLDELATDDSFVGRLDELAAELDDYLSRPLWYQQQIEHGAELPNGIAYFSMAVSYTHLTLPTIYSV